MPTLTAAIIVRDEEANLPRWLECVAPAVDAIVAVDSGSTDQTVAILEAAGARVAHRDWSGYADQRNFCASLCDTDWILFLDADEFADQEFRQALGRLRAGDEPAADALEICRKVFLYGRWLKHGGFFPEYRLRCYRRGRAAWEPRAVHEKLLCSGPVGRLAGTVHHHSWRGVGDYLARCHRYSDEAARQMLAEGKSAGAAKVVARPAWNFLHRYVLRLGFLDGYPGYLAARLDSLYTFSKYARLRELRKERP